MKGLDRAGMLLSALLRQVKSHRRLVCIIFAGLAILLVLVSAGLSPPGRTQLRVLSYGKPTRDAGKSWTTNERTAQEAAWVSPRAAQSEEDDRNWAGLKKMRDQRAAESLWWDERAEEYFISKLEKSQFPADCSKAHWIAQYDHAAGLLSDAHIFQLPLFFAMVRGNTLVPISEPSTKYPMAFQGCGPSLADLNLKCYFNVTNCNPAEDPRLSQIMSKYRKSERSTWDEALMEDDDFFSPGGVTTIQTWKLPPWDTQVCVSSSSFSSFLEAYTYHKLSLWSEMGRHGKVGVVANSTGRMTCKPSGNEEDTKLRRVDMVMASLMSSWLLSRTSSNVKLVADKIMSRYVDTSGQPLWKSPVLAIHIRQTDKEREDPYYREHDGAYRPIEDYALHMKQIEEEYGFEWPSIFLISDSGTAMDYLMTILNGSDSTTLQLDKKRYVMYDWTADEHLVEKYNGHNGVPKALKHEMQTHFLATLYIVQEIADHAIVTYSSNVGRFISEIMAAKHRLAFANRAGPLVTSLDDAWFWNRGYEQFGY